MMALDRLLGFNNWFGHSLFENARRNIFARPGLYVTHGITRIFLTTHIIVLVFLVS